MLSTKKIFVNAPAGALTTGRKSTIIQFVMVSNTSRLRDILAERGIKPTFQRLTILGAVLDNRSHPTIRDLHAHLVRTIPTLSKTTLYSTLERFAAEGLVRPLMIDPRKFAFFASFYL